MMRINEPPTHAQLGNTSMTFHYADGRWIRTQLFSVDWPDLGKVLNRPNIGATHPVPEKLFEGLETIKPFMDKFQRVYLDPQHLRTHQETDEGASFDLELPIDKCVFNLEMLSLLKSVAQTACFENANEQPILFFGERLRGAIIGMRL